MKKVILILSCLFMSVGLIYSQTITVTGTVVDEAGIEVVGASVVVKGTTTGVATDIDGNFSLNVPEKSTLVFSLVGMKKVEKKATPNMKVVMENDEALLEEVIVTGYGTVKKSTFTGSASVLATDKLENIPSISLESKLAGAAAGVKLGSASGQPGSVESMRIRGAGSVLASNEPLYVIDGVPMMSGNANYFDYSESGNSILSTINTNDIESITIIKDAGAAALYGSRAANGVVVITTKTGKAGKTVVNMRANWGFSNMAINYRPTLGGEARRELLHFGLVNEGKASGLADPVAYADGEIDYYAEKPWSGWTDWKDVLLRTGSQSNYELSVQGGTDKLSSFASIAYTQVEGITKASELDRVTGRLNTTYKSNNLTVDFNGMFTNSKQNSYGEGSGFSSPIMAIGFTTSPQDYPYNEDGSINIDKKFPMLNDGYANPVKDMELNYSRTELNRFLGSLSAKYDIYAGLYAKQTISYDFLQTKSSEWWHPDSNDGSNYNGNLQRYVTNRDNFTSQTHLGYNNTFGGSHTIGALLGYEVNKYKEEWNYLTGSDYPNADKNEIQNASINSAESGFSENRMISYLGLVSYDYKSRYYFSANYRRDGSSKFRRSDRWGNFWSVSGSWRMTEESFAEQFRDILNDAKLRMSYGVNGNLPIQNYEYQRTYRYGQRYAGLQGSGPVRLAFEELTWEKNKSLNIGLDLSFINRIDVTLDWYTRNSEDVLLPFATSQTIGQSKVVMNRGKINNQGIELTINSRNIVKSDFLWTTSFNLAHNKNELKRIDGTLQEMSLTGDGTSGYLKHFVGKPFSTLYLYEYAGVDPETGLQSFYKNDEDDPRGITTDITKVKKVGVDKRVDPLVSGGITNNFMYKDFDLGFTLTYALGGHVFDNAAASWINTDGYNYQYFGAVPASYKIEDIWQNPGDNAKLPRFEAGQNKRYASTRFVYSTDHLRLKNITLGYTLPRKITDAAKLGKVRFYASAVNLFTIKSGDLVVDPELPVDPEHGIKSYGVVLMQTPALRTVTFGIDITF